MMKIEISAENEAFGNSHSGHLMAEKIGFYSESFFRWR